jgi:tetratricopeptide (TPR) repeat protein
VDFIDWVSLRLECPAGPPPYAVAGIRHALASRAPGIVWRGANLEASFAAARPHRKLRQVSAERPYTELVEEAKACRHGEWLAWTDVDGDFQLQRVRWALAEARCRTRTILVEPAVHSPGWWEVHGHVEGLGAASKLLESKGAEHPGRLAALVDLEPEAVHLLGGLLERGISGHVLERELLKESAVGRLALQYGLVTEQQLVQTNSPSPAMRESGVELGRLRSLRQAELNAVERRMSEGKQVDAKEAGRWSAWAKTVLSEECIEGIGPRKELAEMMLRSVPRTGMVWDKVAAIALVEGDLEVALAWARAAVSSDPANWRVLAKVLSTRGQYAEAESILRKQLASASQEFGPARVWDFFELGHVLYRQAHLQDAEVVLRQGLAMMEEASHAENFQYGASLLMLAKVLDGQGRYAEGEELLRRSLAFGEEVLGIQEPFYGSLLQAMGLSLARKGQYDDAEDLLNKSLGVLKKHPGIYQIEYASSLHALAMVREAKGRYEEAQALLEQSVASLERVVGSEHPFYGELLQALSAVLERQGRQVDAESLARQALVIKRQAFGAEHPSYGEALNQLAKTLVLQGSYVEAEGLFRQALEVTEKALGAWHPHLCLMLCNLGAVLGMQERPQEGEPFLIRSVEIARESFGEQHIQTAHALRFLAVNQKALGKPEAALTAQMAIDALVHCLGATHPMVKSLLPGLRAIAFGSH